jgi:hypothetical protein
VAGRPRPATPRAQTHTSDPPCPFFVSISIGIKHMLVWKLGAAPLTRFSARTAMVSPPPVLPTWHVQPEEPRTRRSAASSRRGAMKTSAALEHALKRRLTTQTKGASGSRCPRIPRICSVHGAGPPHFSTHLCFGRRVLMKLTHQDGALRPAKVIYWSIPHHIRAQVKGSERAARACARVGR